MLQLVPALNFKDGISAVKPKNLQKKTSSGYWTPERIEKYIKRETISRSSWAVLPVNTACTAGFYYSERKPVKFIGIHHDGAWKTSLKDILKFHIRTNGWGDVAYHFIIDKKGRIYEGRSLDRASDTNNIFDSYGEERLSSIVNVLLLGNYNSKKIYKDSPQIKSAKLLVSYLYLKYPLVTPASIRGHKDFIDDYDPKKKMITCPGRNMYKPVNIIEEIRNFAVSVSGRNRPQGRDN